MTASPLLSVVIPAFNEESNLRELYERLKKSIENTNSDHEIIFVDDGSKDNSFGVLKELTSGDEKVKVIRFYRNFGQHAALRAGFSRSKGKLVIFIDADLQIDPGEIPKLIREYKKGYDVVCGLRERRKDPLLKKFLSTTFLGVVNKLLGGELFKNVSSFVLYDRRVILALNKYLGNSRFITGWTTKMGFASASVRVKHNERLHGKSRYNYRRLSRLFVDVISAFSERPLYIVCVTGVLVSFVNVAFGLAFFLKKLIYGVPIEGFTSTVVLYNIFAGIEIFCVGLIGIYMAKSYKSFVSMPVYITRTVLRRRVN